MISWKTETYLTFNKSFTWNKSGSCSVKGYLFSPAGEFLEGENLASYFSGMGNPDEIRKAVRTSNGQFSLIMDMENVCLMAVDPVRTFPLLYSIQDNKLIISDSFDVLRDKAREADLDDLALAEYLATGYVTGKETLAQEVYQVRAGEMVEFDKVSGKLSGEFYHTYQAEQTFEADEKELSGELKDLLVKVGERLVESLGGKHAVVSLSGGYDSRLIACMLKSAGYKDVTCFTYGRKGNPDRVIAEQVAGKLGFPWIFVEYNEDLTKGFTEDPDFMEYYRYAANGVSMFYLQDYFAVKHLRDNKSVPDDAVFIPGHSGDFIGGSMFIKHNLKTDSEAVNELAARIWKTKYILCPIAQGQRAAINKRIRETLAEKHVVDNALSYTVHEDWDMKEKFSKFIVNSARIYEWFGYEYRLPFWDGELVEFFRHVPFDLKRNLRLYDKVLRDIYFSNFSVDFPVEIRPSSRKQRSAYLKSRVKVFLPQFLKRLYQKQDPIFYYEITRELQQDLEKRGTRINVYNNTYNSLLVQWYGEMLKRDYSAHRAS